jgi:hypothetical protein
MERCPCLPAGRKGHNIKKITFPGSAALWGTKLQNTSLSEIRKRGIPQQKYSNHLDSKI